jgi:hypothetical protein
MKKPATVRIKTPPAAPKRPPVNTFTLVGVNVAKLREFCMESCDGWSIFNLEPLREMGMGEESIAACAQHHESDKKSPKGMIFGEDGKVIDSLFGVYGLNFIARVCSALTGDGGSPFMGRGFRCQDYQRRLKPVFESLIADDKDMVIAAEHIRS